MFAYADCIFRKLGLQRLQNFVGNIANCLVVFTRVVILLRTKTHNWSACLHTWVAHLQTCVARVELFLQFSRWFLQHCNLRLQMCQVIVQMCTYCEQGCPQQKHCLHVCAFSFAHVQVLFARVHVWCAHVKLRYQAFAHLVCKFPILVCNCASLVFHVFLFKWLFASQANLSCMFLQTWIANNVQTWFARFAKNLFRAVAYLLRKLATFVRTFCKFACVCYLCTLGRHCLVFCKRGFPLMRMILYVICSFVLFVLANSHDCYCNLCRLCSQHCQFSCATFANMFFFANSHIHCSQLRTLCLHIGSSVCVCQMANLACNSAILFGKFATKTNGLNICQTFSLRVANSVHLLHIVVYTSTRSPCKL